MSFLLKITSFCIAVGLAALSVINVSVPSTGITERFLTMAKLRF